ncbi:transposable element Tcb1 transposase [Trichonephila clavipes]|nr:transposable element Tcb1 transposase [Trichonephila clavipes]
MTAQRNVHDILQPHVLSFLQRLPGAIFQQDKAQPHTARVSQDCLRTVTILPWPARSPDFSQMKHSWDRSSQNDCSLISIISSAVFRGRGSLVVNVSDRGWYVMSSSLVPLKTRSEGERCTLNLSRSQTSSQGCGVDVKR